MNVKTFFSRAAWVVLMAVWQSLGAAEPVSTTPPAEYEKLLRPLLTPVEKVLQAEPPDDAEEGWVMLDEALHHVLPDGRRIMVHHQVVRALTDSGTEAVGRDVTGYRLSTQKMHLVLAQTIQPDGRRQAVKPEACFLQTPQREADEALYNDSGELVVIFPNVKPGSTVERIVVTEETKQRIPGHYTSIFGFQFGWPSRQIRTVVTLPADYAKRLRVTPLGKGVPEARVEDLPDGARRWTWETGAIQGMDGEPDMAPMTQTGPLVRLTTLASWTEFLDWYAPLADRKTELGAKLEAEVKRLTEKATSPREILNILHARVANDVRYVGLEFGDSDLEPHPVAEVWDHQYGDCKDKASLLRAMLAFKGIPAHMVLINTRHLGRVEKRSPDFRDFNHAILVADLPEGPVFCDPTISGSTPGTLAPSDADRDVLVVTRPERWMRTPPQDAGRYSMNFDARMSAAGEISGWATLEAEGYLGSIYVDWEAKSTRQQIRERLSRRVESCYPGARVVDVKTLPQEPGKPYRIQAYFVVPSSGAMSLKFPLDTGFLPQLGDGRNRRTDVFLWQETLATRSVIELPPGYRATQVPEPQSVKNMHGEGSARWNRNGRKLEAVFAFKVKSSKLPAGEVATFVGALDSLRAWLDKPVVLEAGEGGEPMAQNESDPLGDFPRLPTGEGQLELVAQRFPLDGNLKLRRAAYERTMTFFPKDVRTQFGAQVQIAYIDTVEKDYEAAIRRLKGPLDAQRGQVTIEDGALGDYVLAIALRGLERKDEALEILKKITEEKQVSAFRRSWAHAIRSDILKANDPAKALADAKAGLALEDGDMEGLLVQLAELRGRLEQGPAFKADLDELLARQNSGTPAAMTNLAGAAEEWAVSQPEVASVLVPVLEDVGQNGAFGDRYDERVASIKNRLNAHLSHGTVREKLAAWLKLHPEALPDWEVPADLKTPEDFTAAIEKELSSGAKSADRLIKLSVESLLRFPPGPWYAERMWRAVSYVDYHDRNQEGKEPPELLGFLLDLCEETPESNEANTEARFIRAQVLTRRGDLEGAGKVLARLVEQKGLEPGYVTTAIERYAENCLERGDSASALATWKKLEPHLLFHSAPTELLKACLVALETGREAEALQFTALLRKVQPSVIGKTEAVEHVRSYLQFARNDEVLKAWWTHSARWWPRWKELEDRQMEGAADKKVVVPLVPNLQAFGARIRELNENGETAEMMRMLRLLGHAARWQPSMAVELAGMITVLPQIGQARLVPEVRRVIISIYEEGGVEDPDQDLKLALWAAVSMLDGGRPADGRDLARKYVEKYGPSSLVGEAMLRLWSVGADMTGEQVPDVVAALEKVLAKPTRNHNERARTVTSLASLYRKQERRDAELALLQKEVKNPDTLRGGELVTPLRSRLEFLENSAADGNGARLAVEDWLKAGKPGWFDFVGPKDLQDPKAANPYDAIIPGKGNLQSAERARLCVLLARDDKQPDDRRQAAASLLGWYSVELARTQSQAEAWINALKDNKGLTKAARSRVFAAAMRMAFFSDLRELMLAYQRDPILDTLSDVERQEVLVIQAYAMLGRADMKGASEMAESLLKEPLESVSAEAVVRCIRRLAEGGKVEEARRLYKALGQARFGEETSRQKSAIQLSALKGINYMVKLAPVQAALKDWFMASPLAKAPEGAPPAPRLFRIELVESLPAEEAMQVYREWIRTDSWPKIQGLDFWTGLVHTLPVTQDQPELVLGMLGVAMDKAPEDAMRADLIGRARYLVDIDDAPTRAKLEEFLKPWRARADLPLCQDSLRLHDLNVKLRIGQEVDLFGSLAGLKESNTQRMGRASALRAFTVREDKASLKRMLDGMSTDELMSPPCLDEAVLAYTLLGMTDEAELAREQALQELDDALTSAWAGPLQTGALSPLSMAMILSEPGRVPEAYSKEMAALLTSPREKLLFRGFDARLRGRWEECAKLAAEGIRLYPTFYDFYVMHGLACAELGRTAEAEKSLTTFLKYDHNTHDSKAAQMRLEKLKAAAAAPAPAPGAADQ